jgi:hypothetical protein
MTKKIKVLARTRREYIAVRRLLTNVNLEAHLI